MLFDETKGGQHSGNSDPSRDTATAAATGQIPVDRSAGGGRLDVSASYSVVFFLPLPAISYFINMF